MQQHHSVSLNNIEDEFREEGEVRNDNGNYWTTETPLALKLSKEREREMLRKVCLCGVFVYVLVTCGALSLSQCLNSRQLESGYQGVRLRGQNYPSSSCSWLLLQHSSCWAERHTEYRRENRKVSQKHKGRSWKRQSQNTFSCFLFPCFFHMAFTWGNCLHFMLPLCLCVCVSACLLFC